MSEIVPPGNSGSGLITAARQFLFGLFFGMGFCISEAILHFIAELISNHTGR